MRSKAFIAILFALTVGCSPEPGPDKTAAGAILGAGWGAGAGAVVGNQISYTGEGAAVGAGLGFVNGALTGGVWDMAEATQLEHERQLAALKVQNISNRRQLKQLQGQLDRAIHASISGGVYQVFFDTDETSLKAGSIANLEVIANSIQQSAKAHVIQVVGHSDDSGSPDYNERLAEARARSVSAYLASHGISSDQIQVSSFGSKRPMATNGTDIGRQLNRRVDIYISKN
jgi:outer membrane protein OmpA-like peptidoglycan-associated protein